MNNDEPVISMASLFRPNARVDSLYEESISQCLFKTSSFKLAHLRNVEVKLRQASGCDLQINAVERIHNLCDNMKLDVEFEAAELNAF